MQKSLTLLGLGGPNEVGAWGVVRDKRVPIKLKGRFHRTAVRPTLFLGLVLGN